MLAQEANNRLRSPPTGMHVSCGRQLSLVAVMCYSPGQRQCLFPQERDALMVTMELGACEWFVWDLRRSNLIDHGQLDKMVGEFLHKKPRAEPPELAEHLVAEGALTSFQAERLLQGKTQGFVLGPFTLMD